MSGQDKHRKCIARFSDGAGDVRPGSAGGCAVPCDPMRNRARAGGVHHVHGCAYATSHDERVRVYAVLSNATIRQMP